MRIFEKKTVKIAPTSGTQPPNPVCLRRIRPHTSEFLIPTTIITSSLAIISFYSPQKENKTIAINVLPFFLHFAPVFHFKLCSFCSRVRKDISCHMVPYSYTTGGQTP